MNRTDLKPAKCSLFKTKNDDDEDKTENIDEKSQNTQELSLGGNYLSWQEVLTDLQQRNVDKVAVSLTFWCIVLSNYWKKHSLSQQ